MAIPPWTVELIRRGLSDVAKKAREPETIEKWKSQAGEILQELPQTAARGLDAVMRSAESGKKSVERWTRKHLAIATPMLNASGTLMHDIGTGLPPSPTIAEIAVEMIGGDHVGGHDWNDRMGGRLRRCLDDAAGQSILVAHRFEAAIAAIGLLANDTRPLVIHRSQAARVGGTKLASGKPLPNFLADVTGKRIVEVGGADDADAGDFHGFGPLVTVAVDRGTTPVQPFVMPSGSEGAIQVAVLPIGTVVESIASVPSAASMLAAGFDLVVLRGDGVAGGPTSGVIVGDAALVHVIESHAAWQTLAASDATVAMMVMAVEAASAGQPSPAQQRVDASIENIIGRAERLATRLKAHPEIVACEVTFADAKLTSSGRWSFPSRQLRLRHASKSAEAWAAELAGDYPAVIVSIDDGDLIVDLRWIAPADDAKLAQAVGDKSDESVVSN